MDRFVAQFRSNPTADGGRVSGHASIFNEVGRTAQGLERIDPGAFTRALREEHDVSLFVNHAGLPLARTTSGTLRLGVDELGLTIDADLADTSLGRDIRTLMARGDADRMSFGFVPVPGAYRLDEVDGRHVRTVLDLDLFDVSILAGLPPAYENTDVALRHIDHFPRHSARGQAALIRARIRSTS